MRDVVYPCRGRDPLLQVGHDTIGNSEHVHVTCPAASIRAPLYPVAWERLAGAN